jgi:hypothetical protein
MSDLMCDENILWMASMSGDPVVYISRVIEMSRGASRLELPDEPEFQEDLESFIARLRGYIADIRVRGIDAVLADMIDAEEDCDCGW